MTLNRAAFAAEIRALVRLAVPLAAAQAGTQLMGFVDTAVVGRLGTVDVAAVGLGNAIFFFVFVVGMGLVAAIDPLTAQAYGAADAARARHWLWQGVWLSAGAGLVLMVPLVFTKPALTVMAIDAEVAGRASVYVVIRSFSAVPALMFLVVRSYLQARNLTRPMIVAMAVANVFNLVADIVLVFGGRIFPSWSGPLRQLPALGVAGAAIATVAGSFLQLWILAAAVPKFDGEIDSRPNRAEILKALRLGLPIGMQWCAEVAIFALVGVLAAKIGSLPLAAHQVTLTLVSMTFMVTVGVGSAASVRVGHAIGALDPQAARRAGKAAYSVAIAFMLVSALMLVSIPAALARLVTDQADVVALAIPLMFVAAVFQISDGSQAVGSGILRGMGDTRFPFVANLVGHWAIGLPIALLFGFVLDGGIVGLWWGFCAGLTSVAVLLFLRFHRLTGGDVAPL